MGKHLTLQDRSVIQLMLSSGQSFADIADKVGCHRSTVQREVKNHRVRTENVVGNICIHRLECKLPAECRAECDTTYHSCRSRCGRCNTGCPDYREDTCIRIRKAPYVCNGCSRAPKCFLKKYVYDALKAHDQYLKVLSETRSGIYITEAELQRMDELVSPLIQSGQSVNVVFDNHRAELPVTARTAYKYLNAGLLTAGNLDLARKVKRKVKKKSGPTLKVDKACHVGRTYEDYERYMTATPGLNTVEGDSVEGVKGGKVLLTLLFRNCGLQLMYLRDGNTSASVTAVIHRLKNILGEAGFHDLFQVFLFDRGSEFTDPARIESFDPETGEILSPVFYCDPQSSNQKAMCERNHEFIRFVIPKGRSMDHLTQEKVDLMMNHINSYPRKKWNGKSPLDMFIQIYGEETATLLGLKRIDPDSIKLKPDLLK